MGSLQVDVKLGDKRADGRAGVREERVEDRVEKDRLKVYLVLAQKYLT